MKIESLSIENFRGISKISLSNLGSMVVIAGQNGSGKSCIFDAIRLLKSVYGGYQINEWQQWFGEFNISPDDDWGKHSQLFNDKSKEVKISCDFILHPQEKQYIEKNAYDLLKDKLIQISHPNYSEAGTLKRKRREIAFDKPADERLNETVEKMIPELLKELSNKTSKGIFKILLNGKPETETSLVLSLVFSNFRPHEIGVIDYHSAQRSYNRENISGFQFNSSNDYNNRLSQTALYNSSAKYGGIKSEMAAAYLREIISEKAGVPLEKQATLTNTLNELFETFFPTKKFLGPTPTPRGSLDFPVKTNGKIHDLDELSSGEKEILYGYLRMRNSAPKFSIILLDEPELHLNPRLIRGLPGFYRKNLADNLMNQIWMVSHSDTLLREIVGNTEYSSYYIIPQDQTPKGSDQLRSLSESEDLQLALLDLVGDLAAYNAEGKIIILEGGGESHFDKKFVSKLFPHLESCSNLVSGSNKKSVRNLHNLLSKLAKDNILNKRFFAITDRDSDQIDKLPLIQNHYQWDAYHIENYLIEPKFISQVVQECLCEKKYDEKFVSNELLKSAQKTMPELIRHQLQMQFDKIFRSKIKIDAGKRDNAISESIYSSIEQSFLGLELLKSDKFTKDYIKNEEQILREKFAICLEDGSWMKEFRGREGV